MRVIGDLSEDEITVWAMDARGNDVKKKMKRTKMTPSFVWGIDEKGRDVKRIEWHDNGLEGKT